MSTAAVKRLYVGGLFNTVTDVDLRERFGRFGDVLSVNIKMKQAPSGEVLNTFAYLDFNVSEENYKKCLSTYQKTKWKGHELKLQLAKESFISKLKKELESPVSPPPDVTPPPPESDLHQKVRDIVVKGAPGTKVDSMKDWVVGKYGRVLPVVHIRRKDKRKMMTFDPSKHCHLVKKLETESETLPFDRHITELTWQIAGTKPHPQNKLTTVNSKRAQLAGVAWSVGKKMPAVSAINHMTDNVVGGRNSNTLSSDGGSKISPVSTCGNEPLEIVTSNASHSPKGKINDSTKKIVNKPDKEVSTAAVAEKQLKKSRGVRRDGQTAAPGTKVKQATMTVSNTGPKLLANALSKKSDKIGSDAELKVVEFLDNDGDDDTDDIVATGMQPVAGVKPGVVYRGLDSAGVVDEFSDGLRDMTRPRFTDYYSDDDVFDLIETGRVQDLLKKSAFGLREPTKHKVAVKSLDAVKQITSTFRTLSSLPVANEPATRKTDVGYDSGDSADTDLVIQRVKCKVDATVNSRSAERRGTQLVPALPGTDVVHSGDQSLAGHVSASSNSKKKKILKKKRTLELNAASATCDLKAVRTSASDKNNQTNLSPSVNGSASSKKPKKAKKKNVNKSQNASAKKTPLQVMNLANETVEQLKPKEDSKIANPEACREIQSTRDSSDEDVFELIESGRVTELYQIPAAASCSHLLSASFKSEDVDSDVEDIDTEHQSKMVDMEYDSSDSANTDIIIQRHKKSSTGVENVKLQNAAPAVVNATGGNDALQSAAQLPSNTTHSLSAVIKPELSKSSTSTPLATSRRSVAADAVNATDSVNRKKKKIKQKERNGLKMDDEISSGNQTVLTPAAAAVTAETSLSCARTELENLSKKNESNQKRLASMKERAEVSASQKSAIRQALANIDVADSKSKRIVFDSDSDDGFVDDVDSSAAVANGYGSELPASVADKKEMFLFDSDDDSLDDELNVRTEFSGTGGSKLLELQQRIGGDSRFQLDSRFRDSDVPYGAMETTGEMSEKEKALQILGSIVPQSVTLKRKETTFRVLPRYDPTASNSTTMEIVKEPTAKKQKTATSEKSSFMPVAVPPVELPKVDPQPKFLYSASVFSENSSEKFSLFGCLPPDEDLDLQTDDIQEEPIQEEIQAPKQLKSRMDRMVAMETDDANITNESNGRVAAKNASTTQTVHSTKSFFINDSSEDLKASLEFFCQAHRLSSIRDEWAEKRIQLVKAYRQRHKDALKRQHKTKDQKQQRRVKK